MIYVNTKIRVADNSGIKVVKCINTTRGKKNSAKLGDLINVVVHRKSNSRKEIKVKLYKAIVIRSANKTNRKSGIYIKWRGNAVVMINAGKNFMGTRVRGPFCKEMKRNNLIKNENFFRTVVSYAKGSA